MRHVRQHFRIQIIDIQTVIRMISLKDRLFRNRCLIKGRLIFALRRSGNIECDRHGCRSSLLRPSAHQQHEHQHQHHDKKDDQNCYSCIHVRHPLSSNVSRSSIYAGGSITISRSGESLNSIAALTAAFPRVR